MIGTALAVACRLITGATVEWRCGRQPERPRVYFGNHSSHLDFVVIWSALPPGLRRSARPVAGKDYWEKGRLRRYLAARVFHAVLIERSCAGASAQPAAARAAIDRMAAELDARHALIVFPEGTRAQDGDVGPFKSGLYHLARARPDAELVPVYLENLNRILPKGEFLPVPMLSRVVFGQPLAAIPGEDKPAFLARARQELIHLRSSA
jgi:1-acyl-sn-glycerol-3-phosphate acyltransferase